MAAFGSLTVVTLYLIAQMVGAGKLIEILFDMPYECSVVIVGALMIIYVTFGGMLATTWVQIIKAVLSSFWGIAFIGYSGFITLLDFNFDNISCKSC